MSNIFLTHQFLCLGKYPEEVIKAKAYSVLTAPSFVSGKRALGSATGGSLASTGVALTWNLMQTSMIISRLGDHGGSRSRYIDGKDCNAEPY